MKKIILTVLALIMLTTPVVSSTSFASEPIPDGVILVPEEIAEDIITRLEPVAEQTLVNLQKTGNERLKRKTLKRLVAMVAMQLAMEEADNERAVACLDKLIDRFKLTDKDMGKGLELYCSSNRRLDLAKYCFDSM